MTENFSGKHVGGESLVVDGVGSVWQSPEIGGITGGGRGEGGGGSENVRTEG